ncbi:MAG: flagella basal body P-ring formation protein FlgA [Phycisphaerales bacterium]
MRSTTILASIVATWLAATCAADSVVLKKSARLEPEATTVKLADIAYLDGDEATRFGSLEIGQLGAEGNAIIELETVRAKLSAAGAKLAIVDLSGKAVTVRGSTVGKPVAMKGLSVDGNSIPRVAPAAPTAGESRPRAEFLAADALGTTTPRGLIARMLSDVHAAKAARLRLEITGADEAILDSTGPHRFEIVPLTSLSVDHVRIRLVERAGDGVVARHELSVTPLLEATVATATKEVRRGRALDGTVKVETAWVAPSEFDSLVAADVLKDATAADHVAPGERIDQSKVRKAVEIKKNDKVVVRREVGLVAIELAAIADEDGGLGDVIHFRAVDRKDRKAQKTFTARVTGPGRATVSDDA